MNTRCHNCGNEILVQINKGQNYCGENCRKILNNEIPCSYTEVWTDEAGDIDVCVIHDETSRHRATEGPNRPCLAIDPYPVPDWMQQGKA